MSTMKKTYLSALMLIIVLFVGCSKDESGTNPLSNQAIVITPSDNSENVNLNSSILLQFGKAVDRQAVEKDFHLISNKDITESICPYGQNMMHGSMNMIMMDSMKMNHMDKYHSTHGKFNWNSDSTKCIFTPDSLLLQNMKYMMHFGKGMMNMLQQRMGDMMQGGMMGNSGMTGMGSGQMNGQMMQHFTTRE